MDDATALTTKAPAVRIGIRGLPDHANSMLGGGLYVLIAKTTSARFPMLAGSLVSAFEDGLACTLIVPASLAQFIQRIESLAHINTAELVAANRLQLFMVQDNFLKKMFQFGAGRFVSELEDFAVPENSYLVFDQADELLSLHDVSLAYEQVNVLKAWFAKKGVTALLVFSRLTDAHNSTVNAIMDSLDGIVRLGGEREGLELTFDYWQSPTSVTAAKNYQLHTLGTGLYEACTKAPMAMPLMSEQAYPQYMSDRQLPVYDTAAHFSTRPVAVNLEKYRGYLRPADFLQELDRVLDQVTTSNMPCTLVVGKPSHGMAMNDIVKRYDRSSRLGELITADDQYCYLYLSTGSKAVALENLQSILGLSVDAVFSQSGLSNSHDEIRLALADLSQSVKRGACPDFSLIHDIAAPLPHPSPAPPRGDRSFSQPHDVLSSAQSLAAGKNELARKSENVLLLDFEPAKRSSTPHVRLFDAAVPATVSGAYTSTHLEPAEEVIFDCDAELHGSVFEKKEAPRAKRSLN